MATLFNEDLDPRSKIPIRNVWHMLLYAWEQAEYRDLGRFDTESSPNLLGLLAQVLIESTEMLLKQQMKREYRKNIASVNGIRGRIRFADSIRYIANKQNKTICEFNELNIDTQNNRIIRSTLNRLSKGDRLWSNRHLDEEKLRTKIRSLVRAMEGVEVVQLTNALFWSTPITRYNRSYRLPLQICSLIYQLRMPQEDSGDASLMELIRNEKGLPKLFEQFVRNFYRYRIGDEYEVSSEILTWPQTDSDLVPQMITDISIKSKRDPKKILIIDTKFHQSTLTEHFTTQRIKSDNLYQIYAYLRTQEHKGPAYKEAKGILLYPTVGYEVYECIHMQGHEIKVVTLNLSEPWEQIESRLLELI
jgi:5-methylcytosine-specific restriction enzyme subunit McrC